MSLEHLRRIVHRALAHLLALLLCLPLTGCGENPSRPGTGPGIEAVSPAATPDSIGATFEAPRIFRVVGREGRPQPGLEVYFVSLGLNLDRAPGVYVGPRNGQGPYLDRMVDTTDEQGLAGFRLRLGTRPGKGAVLVLVPALALQDTAYFDVLPGAPSRVRVSPRDTAVYSGTGYELRPVVTDRTGYVLTTPVTFSTSPGATAQGTRVTAAEPRRVDIVVQAGSARDTIHASFVPRGRIAAGRMSTDLSFGRILSLVTFDLDGSSQRVLMTHPSPSESSWLPMWSPDGGRIVFVGPYPDNSPYVVDTTGVMRAVLTVQQATAAGMRLPGVHSPQYSRDGSWIYWAALAKTGCAEVIWRVRPDGSGLRQLTNSNASCDEHHHPSPSPDGTRLVFSSGATFISAFSQLHVLDIASGRVTNLGLRGSGPRWSPVADVIAYIDYDGTGINGATLKLIRPDGTAIRSLARGVVVGLDWSPDGRWIIGRGEQSLLLIDAESGMTLPLPFSTTLVEPTWTRN
jgi:Tol biopolymer transport system component